METTYLISHVRSGSHLLQRALTKHPGLTAWGEVLCGNAGGYTGPMRELVRDFCDYELPTKGRAIIRRYASPEYLQEVEKRADFCKLIYDHVTPAIHEWLRDRKILHLIRQNMLAQYVSLRVASQTKRWLPFERPETRDYRPLTINLRHFEQFQRSVNARRLYWSGYPVVYYHNLVDHWDETIRWVQEFIGVHPLALQPITEKRIRRPLREMITNVREVEAAGYGKWLEGE